MSVTGMEKQIIWADPLNPAFYQDNRGAFSIDIIVWKNDDYVQIADFLEQIKNRDPQNEAVADAFKFANIYREILMAETEAYEELDEARKMIQDLKEETVQPKDARPPAVTGKAPKAPAGTPSMDDQDQKKIRELESKISELMKTLAHLDGMKKELDAERKKTEDLARELEEKEHREQELLTRLEDQTHQPPLLMIASPKDGLKTEAHAISFSGVAQDDTGLTRIDIFLNGIRIDDGTQRGIEVAGDRELKRFDFNRRMPLEKGENRIRILAVDSDGLSSEKSIIVHQIETRKNIWAVVVGINAYSNVRPLRYAANDAHAFHDLLVRQNKVPPENIFFLTDRQASLVNLRSVLGTRLKQNAGKDDMVIVYFAGHGATEKDMMSPDGDGLEKYLLPCDADLTDLYSTALPMREISHIFRRIRSERIIFIADACYSGGSGGRTASFSGIRATISDAFMDRVAGGKGAVIMTASAANEVSGENDRLEHGVFTYYLIKGLKGDADVDADGLVTVDEVYGYVSEWVPKATGQEQHPVKKGAVTGRNWY